MKYHLRTLTHCKKKAFLFLGKALDVNNIWESLFAI